MGLQHNTTLGTLNKDVQLYRNNYVYEKKDALTEEKIETHEGLLELPQNEH